MPDQRDIDLLRAPISELRLITTTSLAMYGGETSTHAEIVHCSVIERYIGDKIEDGEATEDFPFRVTSITVQEPKFILGPESYIQGVTPRLEWGDPAFSYQRPVTVPLS